MCALTSVLIVGCSSDTNPTDPGSQPNASTPQISIDGATAIETDGGGNIVFEVKSNTADFTENILFQFETEGITAEPDVDFMSTTGEGTISVGTTTATITIPVLDDQTKEIDEEFRVVISNPTNATIDDPTGVGVIRDIDEGEFFDEDGYLTPTSYFGYEALWTEEFDTNELDTNIFTFEIGDGCPEICGWGNNELQEYTSKEDNLSFDDGKMVITATQIDQFQFESARIITQDKLEFQFGRIDVRAKLPTGQGLWPAIWMLGANIDDVGWPACGEIDIMELVGSEPDEVLGTAHWGNPGEGSTFRSGAFNNSTDFSEEFHVFSIVWESNNIEWYVDENKFHSINLNTVSPAIYRFNQNFFFILNVAVGGRLPGNPDNTTVFPQTMEIDYMRVFQPVN